MKAIPWLNIKLLYLCMFGLSVLPVACAGDSEEIEIKIICNGSAFSGWCRETLKTWPLPDIHV